MCACVCFVHSWIFRFSGYKDKKETYKDDDDDDEDYEDQDEQNENDNDENDEQVAAKVS